MLTSIQLVIRAPTTSTRQIEWFEIQYEVSQISFTCPSIYDSINLHCKNRPQAMIFTNCNSPTGKQLSCCHNALIPRPLNNRLLQLKFPQLSSVQRTMPVKKRDSTR